MTALEKTGVPAMALPEKGIGIEVLRYAAEHGMIDLQAISARYQMDKQLLDRHPYKIWQGKDGRWYTYLPGADDEKILRRRESRGEIEKVVIDFWQEKEDWPTIDDCFNAYIDRKLELKKIVPSSHIRNKYIYRKHFAEFGKRRIGQTTPEEWIDFLERQIPEHDMTRKAFTNLKTIVRGMLKLAKRKKQIPWPPDAVFQELDVTDREFKVVYHDDEEQVLQEPEMETLIDYCQQHPIPQNLCIILLYATGLRVGEAVALRHEDIRENSVRVRRTESRMKVPGETGYSYFVKDFPKTRAGVRETVLPDRFVWVLDAIQRIAPNDPFVFTVDGERILSLSIRKYLISACRNTGIPYRSPHKIRKTYGTILLDNGVDERFIMRQMGHTSILTTEKYYYFNRRSIDEKREILNSIRDFRPYTGEGNKLK